MNKKWECCQPDESKVNELVSNYGLNEVLARILVNRNITNKKKLNYLCNLPEKIFMTHF